MKGNGVSMFVDTRVHRDEMTPYFVETRGIYRKEIDGAVVATSNLNEGNAEIVGDGFHQ